MRLVRRVWYRAGLLLSTTVLILLRVLRSSDIGANESSEAEAQDDQATDDAEAASYFDTGIDKNDQQSDPVQDSLLLAVVIGAEQHPHSITSPPNGSHIDTKINEPHAHGVHALAENCSYPPNVKHLEDDKFEDPRHYDRETSWFPAFVAFHPPQD